MTLAWISDVLVALMLAVAAVSAARIAAAWPGRRDAVMAVTDAAHVLMAVAMAGMLSPSLGTFPGTAWDVVFGLLTAWFAGRVLADARGSGIRALAGGHCAPHLAHSGSMLYMFLAGSATRASMSGMSGGPGTATKALSHPALAFVFAFILVGYGIWDLDQLSGRRYTAGAQVSLAGIGAAGLPGLDVDRAVPAPLNGGGPAEATDEHAAASRGGDSAAAGRPDRGGRGFLISPAVPVGGRITMGIVMAFMLLVAI